MRISNNLCQTPTSMRWGDTCAGKLLDLFVWTWIEGKKVNPAKHITVSSSPASPQYTWTVISRDRSAAGKLRTNWQHICWTTSGCYTTQGLTDVFMLSIGTASFYCCPSFVCLYTFILHYMVYPFPNGSKPQHVKLLFVIYRYVYSKVRY